MDKRSLRSREALKNAFVSLLTQMPYDDIEIQTITEAADTARVTFYRHYGTKEELLLDVIEEAYQNIKKLEQSIELNFDDLLDFDRMPPPLSAFYLLEQNRKSAKHMFQSPANTIIQQRMRQMIVERVVSSVENLPQYADLPIDFIAHHMASVLIGNVWWWVLESIPYSAEEMARITHWTGLCGALTLIGRTDLLKLPSPEKLPDLTGITFAKQSQK